MPSNIKTWHIKIFLRPQFALFCASYCAIVPLCMCCAVFASLWEWLVLKQSWSLPTLGCGQSQRCLSPWGSGWFHPENMKEPLEKETAIVQPDYVSRFYNRKHHTVHFFLSLQTMRCSNGPLCLNEKRVILFLIFFLFSPLWAVGSCCGIVYPRRCLFSLHDPRIQETEGERQALRGAG